MSSAEEPVQQENKLQRAMAKVKAHLEESGLTAGDIPLAFALHEIVAIGIALGAWGMCYVVQPSKTVASTLFARNEAVKTALARAEAHVQNIKWLKKIPLANKDPLRATTSLAESIVFRGFAKPITFGFKIWACIELTKMIKQVTGQASSNKAETAASTSTKDAKNAPRLRGGGSTSSSPFLHKPSTPDGFNLAASFLNDWKGAGLRLIVHASPDV